MSQYCHLTILKRERIFLLHEEGFSISIIGNDIHIARLLFYMN